MKNTSEVFEDSLTRYKKSKHRSPSKGTHLSRENSSKARSEDDEETSPDLQDEEFNTQKKDTSEDISSQGKLAVIKEEKTKAKEQKNSNNDQSEDRNFSRGQSGMAK